MTTLRCQSLSTCGGSSRHTPTILTSTEIGSPRRSGSGRNEGGGRDAAPCGATDSAAHKAQSLTHDEQSAFQHFSFVGSCTRSFRSAANKAPYRLPLSLAGCWSLAGRYSLKC